MNTLWAMPTNGSLHGVVLDQLLIWNLATLGVLLVLAHALLLYALLRRSKSTHPAQGSPSAAEVVSVRELPSAAEVPHALPPEPDAAHSSPSRRFPPPRPWLAETLPVLACTLLFATMAISSERLWATLRYEGASPSALQVEVVGVQFQWYFRYPGEDAHFGATRPRLVDAAAGNPLGLDPSDTHSADDIVSSILMLPAGREVDLRLRAHDVIHGFFIPGMRLKQNAVPGLELHVHFTPVTAGIYPILCTQVCGSGHARMQAVLRVVPAEEFAAWVAQRQKARQVEENNTAQPSDSR